VDAHEGVFQRDFRRKLIVSQTIFLYYREEVGEPGREKAAGFRGRRSV
jgi:hypothetical protein